jgi:SAM-dependent methyltransferase
VGGHTPETLFFSKIPQEYSKTIGNLVLLLLFNSKIYKIENTTCIMVIEHKLDNISFNKSYSANLENAIKGIYKNNSRPLDVIEFAPGENHTTSLKTVAALEANNIPWNLVLADRTPLHLKFGYENLMEILPRKYSDRVKGTLADLTDLKKELDEIQFIGSDIRPIREVLEDQSYVFLRKSKGYEGDKRSVSFEDGSFDLITGSGCLGNLHNHNTEDALKEMSRVTRPNGYVVLAETQVEKLNTKANRTADALERAKRRHIEKVVSQLCEQFVPVKHISTNHVYDNDETYIDETRQTGDIMKVSAIFSKKK